MQTRPRHGGSGRSFGQEGLTGAAAVMQKIIWLFLAVSLFSSFRGSLWKLLLIIVGGAACFIYFIYTKQENILFQPVINGLATPDQNPVDYKSPAERGMDFESVHFTTRDGKRLHAWLLLQRDAAVRKGAPTILYFHANAGNMGFRLPYLEKLYNVLKANVFIISYRGYGESEGNPSEAGLYLDADAALDWIKKCPKVDPDRIFVFGRSLGGAVAINLASRRHKELVGMILENTFTSISRMADRMFPLLRPIRSLILRMNFDSLGRITEVEHPIIFISGLADEVVPSEHMQELYDAATKSKRCVFVKIPTGCHNMTWQKNEDFYMKQLKNFVSNPAGSLDGSSGDVGDAKTT